MVLGNRLSLLLLLGTTALFAACGDDDPGPADASTTDTGPATTDSGIHPDAAVADTGPRPDAGPADAGDAGPADTGAMARSIIFLHTNDEHSHQLGFAPEVDDFPTPAPPGSGIVGGLKRRARVIEQLRAEAGRAALNSPVALVSAGDQMMGTLFHLANPSRGIDYLVATLLGYDAMTLGNHEFDFGVGALVGALRNGGLGAGGMPAIVSVPVLASNIRFSLDSNQDDALAQLYSEMGDASHPLRRTFVKRFGNVRVGFLGLVGLDAALVAPFKSPVRFSLASTNQACMSNGDCPGSICLTAAGEPAATVGTCAVNSDETDFATHMPALIADAARAVAELRAQDVDLVVALTHVGVNERELAMLDAMGMGPENSTNSEEIVVALGVDQALTAQDIPGIDVIIGGHSHTPLEEALVIPNRRSGTNTYIVQAGSYGRWVGKLRLTQAAGSDTWELDRDYTGLEPVDDTVDTSLLSPFTSMLIDQAIAQVIGGLEGTAVATAGDDLIFPGEQCDGAELPGNGTCAALIPGATGGNLACEGNRQLNLAACVFPFPSCGNGSIEAGEQCDGAALGGSTCVDLGHTGGTLSCNANCTLDTGACMPYFPSLLEVVVNFARDGAPIRDDRNDIGDLFFYTMGTTSFDIPDAPSSNEGNLMNLVTDAERWVSNRLIPELQDDPVRVAINANGVLRDGIFEGRTGRLTVEDLFRVLPLGVSPVETTPGYTLVDFWLSPQEIVAGLEISVGQGLVSDAFWLGVSGMRVDYDLSRPAFDRNDPLNTGRVMRVVLTTTTAEPWEDGADILEDTPLFDRSLGAGAFPAPNRLIHVSTSLYIGLLMESLGFCPRTADGQQVAQCRSCTADAQCTAPSSTCNMDRGQCSGPVPGVFLTRTLMPRTNQELKEFLALLVYVRELPNSALPLAYSEDAPRRMCCVGPACPADGSRTCD